MEMVGFSSDEIISIVVL